MPVLIYFLGSSLLGRYEGASLRRIFESIYAGVQSGSAASWIVLLGPYGLYLIFRALRLLWRAERQAGLIGSPNSRLSYLERGR